MTTYRCGWCGTPTDIEGQPLDKEQLDKLSEEDLNNAELVHGLCCIEEQQQHFIVTRDMALDAGDLSLEGERW